MADLIKRKNSRSKKGAAQAWMLISCDAVQNQLGAITEIENKLACSK